MALASAEVLPTVKDLVGKSREEIARKVANKRHGELVDIIYALATCEPHFTDREIATLRRVGVAKVRHLMKSGVIAPAHKRGRTNAWDAPLSAVRRYDEQTAVTQARD